MEGCSRPRNDEETHCPRSFSSLRGGDRHLHISTVRADEAIFLYKPVVVCTFGSAMLKFLDIVLTLAHVAIIGFNLLGWIWQKTRKAHLVVVAATAFSWFILGIWFGWGYCPITQWQWNVKQQLGETNLPNSFIKYYTDKITGRDINASLVDVVTLITFLVVIVLTVYLNFFKRKAKSFRRHL
jgi:hypothetical protein